jgi:hypothetical protein
MSAINATSHKPDDTQNLSQIIDLACSDRRMSPQRFIPYWHGARTARSGMGPSYILARPLLPLMKSSTAGDAGIILSAFGSWLQALWDHGDPGGPSILFRPTELLTTIHSW